MCMAHFGEETKERIERSEIYPIGFTWPYDYTGPLWGNIRNTADSLVARPISCLTSFRAVHQLSEP